MPNLSFSKPVQLKPGATIGIFSPSGALSLDRHEAGVRTLRSFGYNVVTAPETLHEWRYFAGTDAERLASFHAMLADPAVDAMMMSRGGYGFTRLLPGIDWSAVAASRKIFCGFSDFTAFNLAALARADLITFAGPGSATDFDWRADLKTDAEQDPTTVSRFVPESKHTKYAADHAFMAAHCWPALQGDPVSTGAISCVHDYLPQTLTGPIWGSNLSLFAHLVGTPFMPELDGGILFFEEIGEEPYAVERQFLQLYHAGILQKQKAIIVADFTDCVPSSGRFAYTMEHVVETLRTLLPYPVLTGLPFGHVAKKLTIPYGGQAILDIAPDAFSLSY